MKPKLFFFVLLGFGVVTVAAIGLGFTWQKNNLVVVADDLEVKISDSLVRDEQIVQLLEMQKDYQKYSGLSGLIDSALPKGKRQSELVLQLKQIVTAAGVSFPGISFPATEKPGPTSQTVPSGSGVAVPISLQLKCNYAGLQSILQSLERFNRTIIINSVTISRDPKDKLLNTTLNLTVQVLP